jgi:hypothetical protein|tara:strand:- start:739 stop:2397 length:1659 start_codon:yes stop_codon:yes gene_type:complete
MAIGGSTYPGRGADLTQRLVNGLGDLTGKPDTYSNAEVAPEDPSASSRAVLNMARYWQPISICEGGTAALRQFSEQIIPREDREDDDAYNRRIFHAVLPPFMQRLAAQAAGTILRKGIHLSGGDEEFWDEWSGDVTGDGTPLNEFARKTLVDALLWGHTAVLVDYSADGVPRTLRDERQNPRKPYLVPIHAQQIRGWRTEGNRRQSDLTQIRYVEMVSEPNGRFGEKIIEQVRVLEPGRYEVWRSAIDESYVNGQWLLSDEGNTSLNRVPVVGIYSNRLGTLMSKPPLLECANLTIAYAQRFTDYHNCIHVGSQPILTLKGFDNDSNNELGLSVNTAILLPPDGDAKYVEPTAAAYESQLKCLQTLEDQISSLGISTLARQNLTNAAADARRLDRIDSDSIMAIISQDLTRAIEEIIDIAATYTGREPCKVTLNADYEAKLLDGNQITAMLQLQMQNQISQRTLLEILKAGEVVPNWIDIDQEILRTQDEIEQQFDLELEHQAEQLELENKEASSDIDSAAGGVASGEAANGSSSGSMTIPTPLRPGKHKSD